jgi:hypothetical protein
MNRAKIRFKYFFIGYLYVKIFGKTEQFPAYWTNQGSSQGDKHGARDGDGGRDEDGDGMEMGIDINGGSVSTRQSYPGNQGRFHGGYKR